MSTKTLLPLILMAVAITAAAAPAAAGETPKIAVYVTGNVAEDEKKALGTRMLASLINSGRYIGIERSNAFLAEIDKEQAKQRSGDIDDSQISQLGRQFGVRFVCIADITPAYGEFQVSARIVDVETAVVIFIGESASPLKSMADLARVSDQVVKNMFSGHTTPTPAQPEQKAEPAMAANTPERSHAATTGGLPVMSVPSAPAVRERRKSIGVRYGGFGNDAMSVDAVFTVIVKHRRGNKSRGDLLVSYVNYKIKTEKEIYSYSSGYTYTTVTTDVSGLETFGSYGWTVGNGPVSWYLGFGFGMDFINVGSGYGLGSLTGIEINLPDVAFSVDYHPMFRLILAVIDSKPEVPVGYSHTFGFSAKYRF